MRQRNLNRSRLPSFKVGLRVWGVVILLLAATATAQISRPNIAFEAESGNLSGSVSQGSDSTASGGGLIQFNQPVGGTCPSGQVGTPPNCFAATAALGVTAGTTVNPFDKKMKGIALANWTFAKGWNKPFVGQVQSLPQAMQAIEPGLIRYAGGLWANWAGFDRTRTQMTPQTAWTKDGQTYYYNYGIDELADLDAFAKNIGAEVMIQVNVSNNNPAMWADLVRYAKERGFSSIKYYELSNELDLETFQNQPTQITPGEYANRLAAYQNAMLAVDSTIKIVGGVPAAASDIFRSGFSCCGNQVSQYITQGAASARSAGRDLGAASFHWYQTNDAITPTDVFQWSWGNPASSTEWWRNSYSREWSGLVGPWIKSAGLSNYPNVPLGVSELGVNSSDNIPSNGNHIAALWYSDVLGRMAYYDIEWVTQWDSYASQGEYFSLLYPSSDFSTTTAINARPSYYAYVMYKQWFGDQLVQSSTFDPARISIWASKDSDDPGKLKLRLTNVTGSAITTPVALNGFNATSGQAYTMSSTNPLDTSSGSALATAPTSINGVKINASNVAGSLSSITPTNVPVNGTSFNYTVPAYSSVSIVLNGSF